MRLLGDVQFTYTQTIRCMFSKGELLPEQIDRAASSCSVWTRFLLPDRKLIMATPLALKGMGLKRDSVEEFAPGDTFNSKLHGLIFVIPPLHHWDEILRPRLRLALKQAGVL